MFRGLDSGLVQVLRDSLEMLRDRPVFFVPKVFSTSLSSLWLLGLVEGIGPLSFYLVSTPLVVFTGVFVSVMLAGMVKNDASLETGFREAAASLGNVLKASLFFLTAVFLVSLPASLGVAYYMLSGSLVMMLAGFSASVLLLAGLTFAVYFLPVTLLEQESLMDSYLESRKKSVGNYREVAFLTVFSFTLFGLAFLSQGWLEGLGYAGFVTGRLVSAVVTTYVFVVSPRYYVEN